MTRTMPRAEEATETAWLVAELTAIRDDLRSIRQGPPLPQPRSGPRPR